MANYLVTGGAGFIGSHIARRLLDDGHHVVVIDNLTTGQEENLPRGARFVNLDISRADGIQMIPNEPFDGVLHLAAQSSGEISHDNPSLDMTTNALGTRLLLEWCRENGAGHFIYASSMAIYGLTEQMPVHEDQALDPHSFYGISKQAAEQYVRHYARLGLDTTILRMFNVYGPGQNLGNMKQGMVSIYLAYLAQDEPIVVKGSLDRFRDYVYIDDVVDAWMACLGNPDCYGRVYNLGTGTKTLVRELLPQLITAWGQDPSAYPVEEHGGTPADQFGIYPDVTNLRHDTDWEPRISLPEGLDRMAAWAKGSQA
jgi:UDP-glucose 4-epimerase